MSGAEFEAFADALAARPAPAPPPRPERVAVLGGGPEARLIASLCLAGGAGVTLFTAYGGEMEALAASGAITLRGEGPVGSFAVRRSGGRDGAPAIRLTGELDTALAGAELVFLTGPVQKQRTYAMVLAEHVVDGQVLVLAPGRSLGALEAAWLLRAGGSAADFALVETQGLPYWIRVAGAVLHLTGRRRRRWRRCPATGWMRCRGWPTTCPTCARCRRWCMAALPMAAVWWRCRRCCSAVRSARPGRRNCRPGPNPCPSGRPSAA